jgi:hypothetical protein
MAFRIWYGDEEGMQWVDGDLHESDLHGIALVLAWGGEPVAEGLDRLHRCGMRCRRELAIQWPYLSPTQWDRGTSVMVDVGEVGQWFADNMGGTLVLLDTDGQEIPHG